jgi:hypothetical protein
LNLPADEAQGALRLVGMKAAVPVSEFAEKLRTSRKRHGQENKEDNIHLQERIET